LTVDGALFSGTAQFKFALVNATGSTTWWSHDGTSLDGEEPTGIPVFLDVAQGVFSVNLGDTSVPNMIHPVPPGVFSQDSVWLRTWVNDGVSGFQRLSPDRRITAVGYALAAASAPLPPGTLLASLLPQDPALLGGGCRLVMTVPAPAWVNGSSSGAPSARSGLSAIWDGQQMIVWGGTIADGAPVASGGMYRPDSDSWAAINTTDAPAARSGHTAVWTGSALVVWGGVGNSGPLGTGGRFVPGTQTWTPVTCTDAPSERKGHHAVWTGTRMLVWGGVNGSGLLDDGALYDPVANQWTPLSVPNPPEPRFGAAAVWAGDRLLVWGGTGESGELSSGGTLVFSAGVPTLWTTMSLTGAPSARSGHAAVWNGVQMLIWGGQRAGAVLGDGAAYAPQTETWTALDPTDAPTARTDHSAVWTGTELLIVAGADAAADLSSTAAYDPAAGLWRALGSAGGPLARRQTTAVWTGTEIMVFGGLSGVQRVAALQRLVPQPTWYFYRKL